MDPIFFPMVGFNKDLHLKNYVTIYFNKSKLFLWYNEKPKPLKLKRKVQLILQNLWL